jgi:hypothetical protein
MGHPRAPVLLEQQRISLAGPTLPSIAVDSVQIYWLDCDGSIWAANKSDGSNAHSIVTGEYSPLAIVTDGAHIYWMTGDGNVVRSGIDGSNRLVLASQSWGDAGGFTLDGLALAAGWVLWTFEGPAENKVMMVAH